MGGNPVTTCADHRHHRSGRLLPGRVPDRAGVRGLRAGTRPAESAGAPAQAVARRRQADPRRPARPGQPDLRGRAGAARRGLQPGRDLVRADVVAAGRADRRGDGPRRAARARGDQGVQRHQRVAQPRPRPDPLLPGLVVGDVRHGQGVAADRADAVSPAQPVRRREGVRSLPDPELPRVLRHVRGLGHSVQPRVAQARRGVRDPQDLAWRRQGQARI